MKRLKLISFVLLGAILLSACASSASRNTSWPGLAADTTNAYLADGSLVYAVRLSDGVKVWQYPDKSVGQVFYANPVLTSDGQLLVGSAGNDHALYSLDPATGKEKWPAPFSGAGDHFVASPLVIGDVIYAPNNDGALYALKLSTGEKLWSLAIGDSLWSSPVSNGKLIFVASLDHFVYAVDPQTQKIVWKADIGVSIPSAPAVSADGSMLFVGGFLKALKALNTADGSVIWSADTNDWVWGSPALDGDTVYAADLSGNLYSFGVPNGKNAWPAIQLDGAITASPLVLADGTMVVVTEAGNAFAFDRVGAKAWGQGTTIGGKIYTTPVAAGDQVIVAPQGADALLVALSKSGNVVWKFTGK